MIRRPVASAPSRFVPPPSLDRLASEHVAQWVTRWHGADYDPDEIAEMIEEWPADVSLAALVEPFTAVAETDSAPALARLVLELISLVERSRLQTGQARGAFRLACRHLCSRGVPFEETAKGNEPALWFHFLSSNEFGDPENLGYATDLSELRLIARFLLDPAALTESFLAGEFPLVYNEGYVSVAGALADNRLVPLLVRVLRRSEDAQAVSATINALSRFSDARLVGILEGYAYSTNSEVSTSAVLAIEAIGGPSAERILSQLDEIVVNRNTELAAHLTFARTRTENGAEALHDELLRSVSDRKAPAAARMAAIERLAGMMDTDVIRLLAGMLEDKTSERVTVDGLLTDDVVYTVREAAYMALIDCRIGRLVEVLGEGILEKLETFQMYSTPTWWDKIDSELAPWEQERERDER